MIEFELGKATHQLTPEKIKASYTTSAVIDTLLSWLVPLNEEGEGFNFPQIEDKSTFTGPQNARDYLLELYLNQPEQLIGLISGDIPSTRAIIDLKNGIYTEQVAVPYAEGSGPITKIDAEVLSYLQTVCEDLAS